ncbi:LytR/AlgR family response regulator transcription factor [Paenibacillus fonticola]|uniref:LytR/AlgR family response regulator transcription factor n=1 Tax=Paenibacillus fonticola TaxID=379896 RepID=UPI0003679A08|nr:LytTR family DNA-binding domain-containing protein [Paenibacillus fonticola]
MERNDFVIRIAVCDDDLQVTGQMESLILDAANRNLHPVGVSVFCSGASFSKAIENGCPFDIVFMDIEMEKLDGIQAGHRLRADDDNDLVQLIYVSSHEQYHVQLFDVRPSGFIRKPIEPEAFKRKLFSAMQKAIRRQQQGQKNFLAVQQKGKDLLVPFRDILYLESKLRKVHLYTKDGKLDYYSTLNEEENKLPASDFIRIHQSYIVNFYFVRQLSYNKIMLVTGVELPVSEKRSAGVKQKYLKFRGSLIE